MSKRPSAGTQQNQHLFAAENRPGRDAASQVDRLIKQKTAQLAQQPKSLG